MTWLIAWIVVSIPCALFFSAMISFGEHGQKNKKLKDSDITYELGTDFHDQTLVD